MNRKIKVGMVGLLLAAPTVAVAETPEPDAAMRTAARQIATEGMMAYDTGDCPTAIDKLMRAHEVVRVPTLAYYAGACLEKLGRRGEALRMYEVAVLDPVEGASDVQRKAQEDAAAAKARLMPVLFPPPAVSVPAPPLAPTAVQGTQPLPAPKLVVRAREHAAYGPWVVGAVGVVGLVVGAVTGAIVVHENSVVGANCSVGPPAFCRNETGLSAASEVRTLGPIATTGLVVGGVGIAASAVWLGMQRRSGSVKVGFAGNVLRVEGSW